MTYPIHERFHAFQGEGVHAGRNSFFIRTFGCPVHCPWCDSAGTWHKDWVPKKIKRLEAEELAQEAKETGASFVVITGGEPTVHDLDPLCFEIRMLDMDAHLETCGAFKFTHEAFDWVTLSPKWDKLPLAENLLRADELKLIIEDEDSIQKWIDAICQIAGTSTLAEAIHPNAQVWLHPEWSHREDPVVLQKIANHVKLHGGPFRAGWQLHKLYRVDALDHRAASNAPLGGDPTLGY